MVTCGYIGIALSLLLIILHSSVAEIQIENGVKSQVFLSPRIELEPGLVSETFNDNIDFPKGHIAIKNFYGELVDDKGNSVPLHETYLHHWTVLRYYQHPGLGATMNSIKIGGSTADKMGVRIFMKNSGVCLLSLPQYFGLGSETRRTETRIPDPYGIEAGNPNDVSEGFEERWMLNLHAIDTRGAVDKLGCTECRCDLYNVTVVRKKNYIGGFDCCTDGTRCPVKQGFNGLKRGLYLRYTVTYVDWDASILPVRIYILDSTDSWIKGVNEIHDCQIEYNVEACDAGIASDECIHKKSSVANLPVGGNLIYGVGHQHAGGIGTAVYGEGGREICVSNPIYGEGDEAGNEAGYVVGMTSCYPSPGSIKIPVEETLTFISYYNNTQSHTGLMGLFYLLIADSVENPKNVTHALVGTNIDTKMWNPVSAIALFGVAFIALVIFVSQRRTGSGEGYDL